MGVPDFVKYIARSSPGALCRLPKGDAVPPLVFDFILIDATNAAQTLGLQNLLAFLNPAHILARSAIIFALDSQRDRSGTARSHRHALVRIGDLDVQVQRLCSQLAEIYRSHHNAAQRQRASSAAGLLTSPPQVLTSGRGVAGEADYKLLDLQRSLLTAAIASGATTLPTFLFVSEDSDVLCGALCGPAPQQVSIATKLQDVLYEPSILRLDRVLAFIATCTDAFYAENAREVAAAAEAKARAAAERNAAKAKQLAEKNAAAAAAAMSSGHASGVGAPPTTTFLKAPSMAPPVAEKAAEEEDEEEVELSVEDKAVPPAPQPEQDVVRRRKQDGPMVATGVRIELTDSSDDEKEEEEGDEMAKKAVAPAKSAPTASGTATTPPSAELEKKEADKASQSADATSGATAGAAAESPAVVDPAPTDVELTVSAIAYTSSVDMVFLFMIVMGNAVNVPSLVRGATKVDAGSCWQAYCKQKYKLLSASEAETGRVLLTTSATTHSTNKGSFVLNCAFLHSILEAVHYADAEARPPGEEEKNRALAYLSNAVYATLRYVVGCNLEKPPTLQQTFLDSRPLSETAIMLPSLSAVMWVLGQQANRTFTFPLHGLAKKELLAVASGGAGGLAAALATGAVASSSSSSKAGSAAAGSVGELDVGEHLVAPVAANAWAVRGARASNVSLASLAQGFATRGTRTAAAVTATTPGVALRAGVQLPSMTELLKTCLQKVAPAVLAKANVLVYLVTVWEYALGLGVRHLAALTRGAAHVARAEGGEEVFTAVQTASSTVNPMRAAEGGAAAVSRAQNNTGRYVYSFELRRMAPVMQPSDTAAMAVASSVSGVAAVPPASSSAATAASNAGINAAAPAGAGAQPSAAQQAVLAALGVSYDYSKAPRAPANVVNLPHSAMDEEDKAELQRLKKVAKKERALVASVAKTNKTVDGADSDGKKKETKKTAEGAVVGGKAAHKRRDADAPKKGDKKSKKDKAKGKKRLGKRERLQRQKAMEKAGAEKKPASE